VSDSKCWFFSTLNGLGTGFDGLRWGMGVVMAFIHAATNINRNTYFISRNANNPL